MSAPSSIRLDMSGLACPLPLLGAKKMLDDLPDGQQLVLISDCPGTGDDLAAWAAETGHEVIAAEKTNGRRVAYTIRRRRPDARSGGSVVLDLRGATCPGPIVEARRLLRAAALPVQEERHAAGAHDFADPLIKWYRHPR